MIIAFDDHLVIPRICQDVPSVEINSSQEPSSKNIAGKKTNVLKQKRNMHEVESNRKQRKIGVFKSPK